MNKTITRIERALRKMKMPKALKEITKLRKEIKP
jgi:hypothetical protein